MNTRGFRGSTYSTWSSFYTFRQQNIHKVVKRMFESIAVRWVIVRRARET